MSQQDRPRKKYPSDLTDEPWAIVEPLLPPPRSSPRGGHPRTVDMREVLKTIVSLNRSGCQWDMLPHDVLPKSTVYDSFTPWRDDGTWAKMVKALRERTRVAAGREPTPSAACLDRPSVKTTEMGVPSVGMTVAKKSRGASGICWSIRWDGCSPCSSPVPVSMMAWRPRSCSATSPRRPGRVSSQSLRTRRITTMRWTPGWPSTGRAGASQ
jgi:transposase